MTVQTKAALKAYFNTGDIPVESEFADLVDSIQPRSATLVVAASNATDAEKAQSDYVCDGTADDVEINAAIQALPAFGGKVVLTTGLFVTAASIAIDRRVSLSGAGMGLALVTGVHFGSTEGITTIRGGDAFDIISVAGTTKLQGCKISDMLIQGSGKTNGYAGVYSNNTDMLHLYQVSVVDCQYGFHSYKNDAGICVCLSVQENGLGIYLDEGSGVRFFGATMADNSGDATLDAGGAYILNSENIFMSGCISYQDGLNGVVLVGSTLTKLVGSWFNRAGKNGVVIGVFGAGAGDRNIIDGCAIYGNGRSAVEGEANGVKIGYGKWNIVTSSFIGNRPTIETCQVNGVLELNGVAYLGLSIVSNNMFLGNATAGFVKVDTNSLDNGNLVC